MLSVLFAGHQTAKLQPEHPLWSAPPIVSNKLALKINLWSSFYLNYVSINQIESVNDWVPQNVNHLFLHPGEDKGGENSIADQEVNWRWGRREYTGNPGYLSLKLEPQRKRKPHPRGGLVAELIQGMSWGAGKGTSQHAAQAAGWGFT